MISDVGPLRPIDDVCAMSVSPRLLSCQQTTFRAKTCCEPMRQGRALFNHLVGCGEERRRRIEAKGFGSFEIDDDFILGRHLHRKISRLFAL